MTCACGKGESIAVCCGPVIEFARKPTTAEELARARYTALSGGHVGFLAQTAISPAGQAVPEEAFRQLAETGTFVGFEILRGSDGNEEDDRGWVEFTAQYITAGQTLPLKERAEYRRDAGEWRYVYTGPADASRTVRREHPKVGRNAPCPCGSGKKHKRCCGP